MGILDRKIYPDGFSHYSYDISTFMSGAGTNSEDIFIDIFIDINKQSSITDKSIQFVLQLTK